MVLLALLLAALERLDFNSPLMLMSAWKWNQLTLYWLSKEHENNTRQQGQSTRRTVRVVIQPENALRCLVMFILHPSLLFIGAKLTPLAVIIWHDND